MDARATIEVHHFFSNTTPQFGSLRHVPKTDLERNKTALIPDETIPWPKHTTRIVQKLNERRIFDDFGLLRSPVIQKNIDKRGIPSYLYSSTRL